MDDRVKILVVDDDISLVKLLQFHLEKVGYEVLAACDGEEGLRVAQEAKPHLIILDMNMPKLGGAGFFGALSSGDGALRFPVLVLTVQAQLDPILNYFDVDGFASKPVEIDRLLREVDMIIRRRYRRTVSGKLPVAEKQQKVLLVEDDADILHKMADLFRSAGYDVTIVETGGAVMEQLMLEMPDLIVIKMWLPDRAGDQVIYNLRQRPRFRNIPVILHTHPNDNAVERYPFTAIKQYEAKKSGLRDLIKTNDPEVLLKEMENILGN